jgi:2-amino-4-hydroxy-6-hydroxymethyldihydropteridine diphosphokinase
LFFLILAGPLRSRRARIAIVAGPEQGGRRREEELIAAQSSSSGELDLDAAVVVALGSNLPGGYASSEALLEAALAELPAAGLDLLARSGWWRSAAWPDPAGPEYCNGVAIVAASAGPEATLAALLRVESAFNRRRDQRNAPRTLDLDLIAFGRRALETPALTLPHPRAHERLFVMGPLAEIAPGWRHPALGRTAVDLARAASVGRDARPVSPPADAGT